MQAQALVGGELSNEQSETLDALAARRAAREPLQHLTGVAYFRQLELSVGRGVFVPRPETESLAQLAIDALIAAPTDKPIGIDLGTGSGAIALSMAVEVPRAKIYAVEKSIDAFPFTRKNFESYEYTGAELRLGDLSDEYTELDGTLDVTTTPGGRQPMMNAEVTASADSALIFSFISLRARSTVERLPRASARLPPVFC